MIGRVKNAVLVGLLRCSYTLGAGAETQVRPEVGEPRAFVDRKA
jgi:hypothetical protein